MSLPPNLSDIPADLQPLEGIRTDPRNPNVMPTDRYAKMRDHIGETGKYPALIVRELPASSEFYEAGRSGPQLMYVDGHHRARALRELGHDHAFMQNWGEVSDMDALIYMDTLNYNKGEPDAKQRAENLHALSVGMTVERISSVIPLEVVQIEHHLNMRQELIAPAPPPPPPADPSEEEQPIPVRIVMYPQQKKAVDMALDHISRDLTGNNKQGQALELMARDYLAGVSPDEVAALEAKFSQMMTNPFVTSDEGKPEDFE